MMDEWFVDKFFPLIITGDAAEADDALIIQQIVTSKAFLPAVVPSLEPVEKACRDAGREFIRLHVSADTDDTDLFGFRTLGISATGVSEPVFKPGAVTHAMNIGAVLMLDGFGFLKNRALLALCPLMNQEPVPLADGSTVVAQPGFTLFVKE
jgi:hypothetical protein